MKLQAVALRLLNISIIALVWLLVVLLLYRFGLSAYEFGYRIYTEPPVAAEGAGRDILVTINDTSVSVVSESLYEKGLVRDRRVFEMELWLSQFRLDEKDRIKPGVYTLSTSMSYAELIAVMSGGELSDEEPDESVDEPAPTVTLDEGTEETSHATSEDDVAVIDMVSE